MIEFDRTWNIEENNQAFGRAYNALLNHLHLSVPIIGGTYGGWQLDGRRRDGRRPEKTHMTFQNAYTQL
jgi:hypothetical protein